VAAGAASVPMALRGLLDRHVLLWSVASVPVLPIGSALGAWAFDGAPARYHRLTTLVVLLLLAAAPIGRAPMG
jgi:hypothetical protein